MLYVSLPERNFNPLPPHGGRHRQFIRLLLLVISIHSLRMEGDLVCCIPLRTGKISIHSLRMEGDSRIYGSVSIHSHFNPLPPHGGRLNESVRGVKVPDISIHSLRMEGDLEQPQALRGVLVFQSTPSAWRETAQPPRERGTSVISIHSLRMEGDRLVDFFNASRVDFNPLPPHGGRQLYSGKIMLKSGFQSTPSAWRETQEFICNNFTARISIHSLRMEGDENTWH